MDTNQSEPIYKEESYKIVGCAIEILNTLGPGLLEKAYENALTVEFRLRAIPFSQQSKFPIVYKGELVGEHIPDLVVFGKIVVDCKTVEDITDDHRAVMLSYLRVTGCKLGLYLNFKRPSWVLSESCCDSFVFIRVIRG
jgi:GxxExxY protein